MPPEKLLEEGVMKRREEVGSKLGDESRERNLGLRRECSNRKKTGMTNKSNQEN